MSRDPDLQITPEPTPEEMAAIAAAITIMQEETAQQEVPTGDIGDIRSVSRWSRAGRYDAMRGLSEEFH